MSLVDEHPDQDPGRDDAQGADASHAKRAGTRALRARRY